MAKTHIEALLKDKMNEEKFLEIVQGGKIKYKMDGEIDAMVRIYNVQLEEFIKNRFDEEIFKRLAEIDPEGGNTAQNPGTYTEKYQRARVVLQNRKITLGVCREQILALLGKHGEKEN